MFVCAILRIITYKDLSPNVVKGSAGVVQFDKMFGLTTEEVWFGNWVRTNECIHEFFCLLCLKTQSVSDHYPVEISLQGETVYCKQFQDCQTNLYFMYTS